MVRALEIAVHLCAQKPAGERVVRIASDAGRPTALDGSDRRAGIGTIVRTRPTHSAGIAVSENCGAHGRARSRTGGDRLRKGMLRAVAGPRCRAASVIRSFALSYRTRRSRSKKWRADSVAPSVIDARQCERDEACIRGRSLRKRIAVLALGQRSRP